MAAARQLSGAAAAMSASQDGAGVRPSRGVDETAEEGAKALAALGLPSPINTAGLLTDDDDGRVRNKNDDG